MLTKIFNKVSGLLIVFILSLIAIVPLFASGFFPIHDDTQVARVNQMAVVLSEGVFPVRWVPDLGYGYGYPIFNFYAPFAYYVGGFIDLIGFDSLTATKIMIGLGSLCAAFSMYLLAKEFWGKSGAIISALLYMYAPYHAVNIYVRGAVGELWGYGLVPLVFWGLYKIFHTLFHDKPTKHRESETWIYVSITAVSYCLIITSHNLTAFMVSPIIFIISLIFFVVLIRQKKKNSLYLLISLFLGIILAAFYWIPATFEMKYTNVLSVVGGGSDYKDHFVCFNQLINSPWGFGGSAPGCVDGMSFKIGKLGIVMGVLSLITLFYIRNKEKKYALFLGIIGAGLSVFLLLDNSKLIWDFVPQMAFFQFPWRFLLLVMFFLSFIGGAFMYVLPKNIKYIVVVISIMLIVLSYKNLFVPSGIEDKSFDEYTNTQTIQWKTSKISDEYMPQYFARPKSEKKISDKKISFNNPDITYTTLSYTSHKISIEVNAKGKATALFPISYFPAWKIYVDEKESSYEVLSNGLLVAIPEGKHRVTAKYEDTKIEAIANSISLTGVIIIVIGIIYLRKRPYEYKKTKS